MSLSKEIWEAHFFFAEQKRKEQGMLTSVFTEDAPKRVIDIPLNRIEPNPDQPRRFFDIEALTELAASIDEYGVIQPITVRKTADGRYSIVAGERRYRASCLAKRRTIPAIVIDVSDETGAAVSLLENLQRKDLTFFEEAEGYARLMREYDMTQEELSEKLGKSQSAIANKIRLLRLEEEIKQKIFDAGLTERHARALLRLSGKNSREKALRQIVEKRLNVTGAERLIEKMAGEEMLERRCEAFRSSLTESAKRQRVFCSTINRAIRLLNRSGIETSIEQSENETEYRYVIGISK